MKNTIPESGLFRSMGFIMIMLCVNHTLHASGGYPTDHAFGNAGGSGSTIVVSACATSSDAASYPAATVAETTQNMLKEFNLSGEWAVNVNNNRGYLTFRQEGLRLTGKILGDDLHGEISTGGVVRFTRSGANQDFTATVNREPDGKLKLTGTFDCPVSGSNDLRWVALMLSEELPVKQIPVDETPGSLIQTYSLSGEWGVNSNNNRGYLTFRQEGKNISGKILGDALHGEVFIDGTVSFTRSNLNQSYTGILSLEPDGKLKLTGTFSCPTTRATDLRWVALQITEAKPADGTTFLTETKHMEMPEDKAKKASETRASEARPAEARPAEARPVRDIQVAPETKTAMDVVEEETTHNSETKTATTLADEYMMPDWSNQPLEGLWVRDDGLSLEISGSVGVLNNYGRSLFRRANTNPGDLIFRDISQSGSNTWSLYVLWAYSPDIIIATAWSEKSTMTLSPDGSTLTVISEFRNPGTNETTQGTRIYQRNTPVRNQDQ